MNVKQNNRRIWLVFVGLCLYYFVAFGLIYNGLGMFLTPISTDLGIPFVQVSFSSTVRILVGMVTTAAAGRLIPRLNLKWFLSLNVLVLAGAALLISVAQGLIVILIGSALMGFGAGFALYAIVPIVINQWFKEPTGYVSIATAMGGAGGILFCPIITAAISAFGWRGAYRMIAWIVLAVMLPLALFVIRYSPKAYGLAPYEKHASGAALPASENRQIPSGSDRTVGPYLYGCVAVFFVCASVLSGMYGHIASALWAKGFSDLRVGVLTSCYQFGTMVIQLIFGWMSLKIGAKKSLYLILPAVILACVGLTFMKTALVAPAVIFVIFLGFGRSFGVINPIITREIFGSERFTAVYANLYSVFLLGTAGTATLFGAVYHLTNSYNGVYALIAVCALAQLLLTAIIDKRKVKGNAYD